MSQHSFETIHDNESTHVLMGWDRPLQGFFMVIEKANDNDIPFWSNLIHHAYTHPKTLNPFLKVLKTFGITIPQEMIKELIQDGLENIGNKEVLHAWEGEIYYRTEI